MSITIVTDITTNGRTVISGVLPAKYKQLDYQEPEQFSKNNLKGKEKRFGWVSSTAVNNEEIAPMGFQGFSHTFLLTLLTDFNTKDDDTKQEEAKNELYQHVLSIAATLRKTKVGGTVSVCNVLVGEIAEPDFLDNNSSVALVTAIIVQYRYRI